MNIGNRRAAGPRTDRDRLAMVASGMADRSDGEVRRSLESLSRREMRITIEVLLHLVEVERQKIFAKAGYGSLFEYCTGALAYSESAAGRRIRGRRRPRGIAVPRVCLKHQPKISQILTAAAAVEHWPPAYHPEHS